MASSRRTYDTDVITLRKVFAKDPGNSNVPAMRTLTADGQGGTYWAIPSSLGLNPSFNEIITSAGTYTADLSYNKFRLLAGENMGMVDGPPGSNQTTLFAKAFSQLDISGENSIYAFGNNQLDSSVTLAGQNGITLRADPGTNTLFIAGPTRPYAISTGIYGFSQIKVTEQASTITSNVLGWDGTYITSTSPSTLLRFIGHKDIQLSTNVTTDSIFFTISTFNSADYLNISNVAYSAYPSTLSTVSSVYVQFPALFSSMSGITDINNSNYSTLSSALYQFAISTGLEFSNVYGEINARALITQLLAVESELKYDIMSTSIGLGTLGYISTGTGSVVGQDQLISTVQGLGTVGYVSTAGAGDLVKANLFSTVEGLGSAGYVSSLSTIITSSIFNTGAISTYSLEVFGPATLTNSGSTILRGPVYIQGPTYIASSFNGAPNTIVTPTNLASTVRGLGSAQFVSSSQLLSSVVGMSNLRALTLSTGYVQTSSVNVLDVFTGAVNYLTFSSGSLLINGAKISGGGGGGNVAQIVAGTNISVSPPGGTGVVTITNTGPTTTDINNSLSTFSTALGPFNVPYNYSTISTNYGNTFTTSNFTLSSMNTANIRPSNSNLWVAVGYKNSVATDSIQTSPDGVTWSDTISGGFSLAGRSVAYNGSLWVAVGNNGGASGSIQYSGDGKNWSNSLTGGFSSGGNGIAWNGSRWIAVGNNGGSATTSIQTSVDGVNWTGISSGGFSSVGEGIAWNGYYWIAVGQGVSTTDTIQYSVDGLNWVTALTGGFSVSGKGVAWNGSLWVAVGDDSTAPPSIQYSRDGRNWSNSVSGGFASAGWKVAWNGKLWVAVGDDNTILKSIQYSVDGSNWSDITSGGFTNGSDGFGIAWNGSLWVAVGNATTSAGSIQTSRDGIVWTNVTSGGFASQSGLGVAFSSNATPAYAQENLRILPQNIPLFYTSTNQFFAMPSSLAIDNTVLVDSYYNRVGINCNTPAYDLDVKGIGHFDSLSSLALNVSSLNGARYNDPTTIYSTVAGLGQNYVSTSGLTSTVRGLGQNYISSPTTSTNVLSSGQIFVSSLTANNLSTFSLNVSTINGLPFGLPGYPSTVSSSYATSFNTLAFTTSSINVVNIRQNYTNLWVAVGSDNTQNIKYSYDGMTWSSAAGAKVFANNVGYGVAWNGSMWVAVGYDTSQNIKYSYDGINWSSAAGGKVFGLDIGRGIAWNGRIWVAVGEDATQNVKYSSDGINWTNATGTRVFGSAGRTVAWNGKMWLAGGDDTTQSIKYSYNGYSWTKVPGSKVFDQDTCAGIAWNGYMWVAAGWDTTSSMKYSYDGFTWFSTSGYQLGNAYSIAWNGRIWIAGGNNITQNVAYSYDGINWTKVSGSELFNTDYCYGLAWNGQMWLAIGFDSVKCIKYSYDGLTWTNITGSQPFGNNYGTGIAYSYNPIPSYNQTNFEIEPQNIPVYLRSTNQLSFTLSSMIFNNTLYVDGFANRVGVNIATPSTDLDVNGIGRFLTLSTQALNLSSINGANFATILPSTVQGLGSASYVSTASLTSTVAGLAGGGASIVYANNLASTTQAITYGYQTAGFLSTPSLVSTVAGLGGSGIVYTSNLTSTTASVVYGYQTAGFLSTTSLASTTQGITYGYQTAGFLSTTSLASTTQGITYGYQTAGFLSTTSLASTTSGMQLNLNSTIQGLATYAYISSLSLRSTIVSTTTGILTNAGYPSTVSTSYATNFNTLSLTTSSMNIVNIAPSPSNLMVAVGSGATTADSIEYSYDGGSNWTSASSGGFTSGGRGIAWSGSMWVAVGFSSPLANQIQYSYDGINWTNQSGSTFSGNGEGVAWNGQYWIAVGSMSVSPATGSIKRSADGITWTNNTTGGFSGSGYGIAWNGKMWVAVGDNGGTTGSIQYSYDGYTWANNTSGGFANGGIRIAWNGRIWVAVGNNGGAVGSIQYSTDGRNWTNATSGGFSVYGEDVAWNGRMWVAVGGDATSANSIQYSYDGINWSNSSSGAFSISPGPLFALGLGISWNGKQWVATGLATSGTSDSIKLSSDGINWTNYTSGSFTTAYRSAYNANLIPSYNQTSFEIEPQNIPVLLRSTNQMSFTPSTIILNNTLFVDAFSNRVGVNIGNPGADLDVGGVSRALTLSTFKLNASSIFSYNASLSSITSVSSLTFGTGSGWLTMGAVQAAVVSSIQQNTMVAYASTMYCGVNTTALPTVQLDVAGTARAQILSTLNLNVSSVNGAAYGGGGGGGTSLAGKIIFSTLALTSVDPAIPKANSNYYFIFSTQTTMNKSILLDAAATYGDGWNVVVRNTPGSFGLVTVNYNSGSASGSTIATLAPGTSASIVCDATNYYSL